MAPPSQPVTFHGPGRAGRFLPNKEMGVRRCRDDLHNSGPDCAPRTPAPRIAPEGLFIGDAQLARGHALRRAVPTASKAAPTARLRERRSCCAAASPEVGTAHVATGATQKVSAFDATFDEASTQQSFNDIGLDSIADGPLIDAGSIIIAHGRTHRRRTPATSTRTSSRQDVASAASGSSRHTKNTN